MKKTGLILLTVFVVQLFGGYVSADSPSGADTDVFGAEQTELMMQLGVFDENTNAADEVTRGQAARYISVLYGLDADIYAGQSAFPDVPADNIYAKYIAACTANNLLSGDDGFYYPNRAILPSEFIKLMVDILGYSPRAKQGGGYPNGFNSEAARLGILKNINVSAASISHGQAADIIERAFDVKLMKVDTISTDKGVSATLGSDETILSGYMNISRFDGVVRGIGECVLDEITGRDGCIYVGASEIHTNESVDFSYLGMPVEVYVRDDNGKLWLSALRTRNDKCRVIDIMYDETEGNNPEFSPENIVYSKDNSIYSAKLSGGAAVIYNGKRLDGYSAADFCPVYGNVTLIDTDKDGTYDVAKIWSWTAGIIKKVMVSERLIILEDGSSLAEKDFKDSVTALLGGKSADIRDYKSGMTLLTAISKDGGSAVLNAVENSISGTVTRVSDDSVVIGGIEYKTICSIAVGTTAVFYLDGNNTIVDFKKDGETAYSYGYVAKVAAAENFEKAKMRVLTEKNGLVTFSLKDSVTFNGRKVNSSDVVSFYSSKRQLIRYRTNAEGDITLIETPRDVTAAGVGFDKEQFSLDYKNSAMQFNLASGGTTQNTFGRYYMGDASTVVMRVPSFSNPGDEEFKTVGRTDFSSLSTKYDVEMYDSDEWFVPRVVVVYSHSPYFSEDVSNIITKKVPYGTAAGIVISKEHVMVDDEQADCVKLLINGSEVSRYCLSRRTFTWETVMGMYKKNERDGDGNYVSSYPCPNTDGMFTIERDLQIGDIVQLSNDSRGIITGMRMLHKNAFNDSSSPDVLYTQKRLDLGDNSDVDADGLISFDYVYWFRGINTFVGEAVSTDGERVVFELKEGVYRNLYMTLSRTIISNCMIYDSKKDEVTAATPLDIKKGDTVAVVLLSGGVSASLIIR